MRKFTSVTPCQMMAANILFLPWPTKSKNKTKIETYLKKRNTIQPPLQAHNLQQCISFLKYILHSTNWIAVKFCGYKWENMLKQHAGVYENVKILADFFLSQTKNSPIDTFADLFFMWKNVWDDGRGGGLLNNAEFEY